MENNDFTMNKIINIYVILYVRACVCIVCASITAGFNWELIALVIEPFIL